MMNTVGSVLLCAVVLAAPQAQAAQEPLDEAGLVQVPVAALTQQQVAACTEEIRRVKANWKYSPGSASDAVARLGHLQKELFQGRCAGHPQAQAYVDTAHRMLQHVRTSTVAAGR